MNGPEPGVALDGFLREAALIPTELWWRYFSLGGNASPRQVVAFLAGTAKPSRVDYNLLAQALNERFREIGRASAVPYIEPI